MGWTSSRLAQCSRLRSGCLAMEWPSNTNTSVMSRRAIFSSLLSFVEMRSIINSPSISVWSTRDSGCFRRGKRIPGRCTTRHSDAETAFILSAVNKSALRSVLQQNIDRGIRRFFVGRTAKHPSSSMSRSKCLLFFVRQLIINSETLRESLERIQHAISR